MHVPTMHVHTEYISPLGFPTGWSPVSDRSTNPKQHTDILFDDLARGDEDLNHSARTVTRRHIWLISA